MALATIAKGRTAILLTLAAGVLTAALLLLFRANTRAGSPDLETDQESFSRAEAGEKDSWSVTNSTER